MRSANAISADTLSPPGRVGRFSILSELGKGSTGTVYLAHDPLIGRDVAIKILHAFRPPAGQAAGSERLLNEGRAAGRLCHPGIVTVFEAGHEGDVPYLVMEYLNGTDLGTLLAQGRRFTFTETARIVGRLAKALSHAHRHAVVHRDVKPANIFMVSGLRPKLLDFGIARAPDRLPASGMRADVPYTLFHRNLLGTPQYASPEQALGHPADARSDIYALGVILYELLTGERPYSVGSPADVLHQASRGVSRKPHDIDPRIPRQLSAIAIKAMQRYPERRYQHAHEMSTELRRYLTEGQRPDGPALAGNARRFMAASAGSGLPLPDRALPLFRQLAVLAVLLLV